MNTAIVKVNKDIKQQAQELAEELGYSLSGLINGFLKQFVKTKTVVFKAETEEKLNDWAIKHLKEVEKDRKAGWVSPTFDNAEDSLAWLKNPKKKFLYIFRMTEKGQ